jgi:hypothetical protein
MIDLLKQSRRQLQRARSIRVKLGGSGSLYDPFPPKPKWMRETTYFYLRIRAIVAANEAWPPWLLKQIGMA